MPSSGRSAVAVGISALAQAGWAAYCTRNASS
jgi:hypothetical protein